MPRKAYYKHLHIVISEQWSINNVSIKYFHVIKIKDMRKINERWDEVVPCDPVLIQNFLPGWGFNKIDTAFGSLFY